MPRRALVASLPHCRPSVSHSTPTSTSAIAAATRLRLAFAAKPVEICVLKEAVRAYVDEMKRVSAPVERTIIEIKRIADAALGPTTFRGKRAAPRDEGDIVDQAVTWCIDHYYKASDS